MRILLLILAVAVAAVVVLVALLTVFPMRFTFEYKEPGLLIQLRIGPFRITILRRETPEQREERKRKKAEKAAKRKKKKKTKPPPDPEKKKAQRQFLVKLAKRALEEVTRKKMRLDKLWLDVVFGGENPASTAMLFGGANAGLGALWPVVEHFLIVKDRRIRTAVDFNLPATRVDYFCAVLPLPLVWALGIAIRLLIWFLRERRAGKKTKTNESTTNSEQKEAV